MHRFEAGLLTPVYAFDHEVIPAGTQVLGHVSRTQPVSRLNLAKEPLRLAASGLTPGGQDFHGFLSAGEGVFDPVYLPHPAATEGADDPVGVNDGTVFKLSHVALTPPSRLHRQERDERHEQPAAAR
jgi:hypothetical protein